MAFNTIFISIVWIVNDFTDYASYMNIGNLKGNQFLNFFLIGIATLPAPFVGGFFINR